MGQQQGASANGTDGGGAVENAWVAALVQTNCERQVARKLEPLSFECYVPVQEEIHLWSDRKKKVQRLVIPNIVFVKTPQPRFDELKRLSFVRGLLSHPGEKEPAKIPEVQMEKLRFMLGQTDIPVELEKQRAPTEGRRWQVSRDAWAVQGLGRHHLLHARRRRARRRAPLGLRLCKRANQQKRY
jgi:hypothetical protein